jgi:hypothetical protein
MRVNPLASPRAGRHSLPMADKDKPRDERLAAALRENLRRRKAQARELTDVAKNPEDQP